MKSTAYYIKSFTIALCLFFESFLLSQAIIDFVRVSSLFSVDWAKTLEIIFLMIIALYTFALGVGAWDKWEQYVITPIPLALGVFTNLFIINITHALVISFLFVAVISLDVYRATRLSKIMITFDPSLILRLSANGILFLFSIYAGILVILSTTGPKQLDLGKEISNALGDTMDAAIKTQLQQSMNGLPQDYLTTVDPALPGILEQFGLPSNLSDPTYLDPQNLGINSKDIIETQVNNVVAPYRDFLHPLMALLMFGIFQFYAAIAALVFFLTIRPIFWLARKTGFFRVETIQVTKELLKF